MDSSDFEVRTLLRMESRLFGMAARMNRRLIWRLDFEMEQTLAFRAISSTALSLPKVTMAKAGTGFEVIIARYRGVSLTLPIEAFYHFGAEASGMTFASGLKDGRGSFSLTRKTENELKGESSFGVNE